MKAIIEKIKTITAEEFGITAMAMSGPTRSEAVVVPRMTAMQLVWRLCGVADATIAHYFKKNPGTVHHARKRVSEMLETNKHFKQTYEKIWNEIKES